MPLLVCLAVISTLCAIATGQPKPSADQGTDKKTQAQGGDSNLTATTGSEISYYADSQDVTVTTPAVNGSVANTSAGWSVGGNYLADVVTAASVDIVATASPEWREVRHAGGINAGLELDPIDLSTNGSVSREPDYLAFAAGATIAVDFAQSNYTALVGYAYGNDTVGRVGTPFSVFSNKVQLHTLTGSFQIVLNRSSFLAFIGDVTFDRGDNSKPYRYIPMFAPDFAPNVPAGASIDFVNATRLPMRPLEQLPTERNRYSATVRFGYRFKHATLRLSERLYTDTWGLDASTTHAQAIIDANRRWSLWPMARFHIQSAVTFWQLAYSAGRTPDGVVVVPALRTGDRELGGLTTVNVGAGVRFAAGSAGDPNAIGISLQAEAMRTWFDETLYVTRRDGVFAALALDATFR